MLAIQIGTLGNVSNALWGVSGAFPLFNPLNIGLAVANLYNRVATHDLTIEVGHDFTLFREMCAETEKQSVSNQFSPAKFDLLSNNSFWVVVKTSDGRVVCTQALRLDDIGSHDHIAHARPPGRINHQTSERRHVEGRDKQNLRCIHQFGGKAGRGHKVSIPARPYIGMSADDWTEVNAILDDYLETE